MPSFFQDGWKAAQNLYPFIEKLAVSLHAVSPPGCHPASLRCVPRDATRPVPVPENARIRRSGEGSCLPFQLHQAQEEEVKQLTQTRDSLRSILQLESKEVRPRDGQGRAGKEGREGAGCCGGVRAPGLAWGWGAAGKGELGTKGDVHGSGAGELGDARRLGRDGGLWHSAGRCTHVRMRSLGGSTHFCTSHFAF